MQLLSQGHFDAKLMFSVDFYLGKYKFPQCNYFPKVIFDAKLMFSVNFYLGKYKFPQCNYFPKVIFDAKLMFSVDFYLGKYKFPQCNYFPFKKNSVLGLLKPLNLYYRTRLIAYASHLPPYTLSSYHKSCLFFSRLSSLQQGNQQMGQVECLGDLTIFFPN